MVPKDKDVMSAFKHNAAFDILCRTGVKGVEMEEASLEEKWQRLFDPPPDPL